MPPVNDAEPSARIWRAPSGLFRIHLLQSVRWRPPCLGEFHIGIHSAPGAYPPRRRARQSGAVRARGDRGRPLPAVAAGAPAQGAAGEDRPGDRAGRRAVATAESAEFGAGEEAAAVGESAARLALT